MPDIVKTHTHNGSDSPRLTTADWVKIITFTGPPNWVGRQGEMVFESSGDFNIWVYLDGDWRQFAYTP